MLAAHGKKSISLHSLTPLTRTQDKGGLAFIAKFLLLIRSDGYVYNLELLLQLLLLPKRGSRLFHFFPGSSCLTFFL